MVGAVETVAAFHLEKACVHTVNFQGGEFQS
jgi:hypothetical protein